MKNKVVRIMMSFIGMILLGAIFSQEVKAEETNSDKAQIVLHKKQMINMPDQIQNTGNEMTEFDKYEPLSGMEFKLYDATKEFYQLRQNNLSSNEAIRRIQAYKPEELEGHQALLTEKTNSKGELTFEVNKKVDGKDAVYLIVETDVAHVIESADLVVAFPVYEMTDQGTYTDKELDTIHLYPKNMISNSGVLKVIKKASYDNTVYLDGAKFIVSREQDGGSTEYLKDSKSGIYTWSTNEKDAYKFVTGNKYTHGDNKILEAEGPKGEINIEGLPYGTYKVTEVEAPDNASMIAGEIEHEVTITETQSKVEVSVINDKVKVDKTSDENNQSIEIGQRIGYTINSNIPMGIKDKHSDGRNKYETYKLVDKHSKELTFENTATGEFAYQLFDGEDLISPDKYTVEENENGFIVSINADYIPELTPNGILKFTYFMYLNENAVPGTDYQNTVDVEVGDLTDVSKPVKVKTGGAKFQKIDVDDNNLGLQGAEFVILNKDQEYLIMDQEKNVKWTTNESEATKFVSGEDGIFEVTGLAYGTYELKETKAPEGYVLLSKPIEFKVNKDSYEKDNSLTITNKHKGSLPLTGGMGTVVFIVGGLSVFGLVILYFRRRLSDSK
ncbi:SpaH/EbpB family LPXTG-anchored major pilin [Vagococcus fluvialis]|uniref:SpaH/EbpB family LPXTG-anchored major pilin n=1 Tax=Vagococcus fluvialis TaxID=2738 RepID=UPI001A90509F|nr:SpaH/EbpB family LPXTG-anchored major pilin [Vagococcus fluvialis]MBO0437891.1 SpaH/EbpB family LPXTG-anchored major pilin [Vagococcus fluvialis]